MDHLTPHDGNDGLGELEKAFWGPLQEAFSQLFAGFEKSSLQVDESETEYHLTVELPALEKHKVNVSINGNQLTIAGDLWQETTSQDSSGTRQQAAFHQVFHSFTLPPAVDTGRVNADMEGNRLHVVLPKRLA